MGKESLLLYYSKTRQNIPCKTHLSPRQNIIHIRAVIIVVYMIGKGSYLVKDFLFL